MNPHTSRAQLLMSHRRFELAEQELGLALAEQPEDARLHALLAICLTERKQFDRAIEEARVAVHHGPDEGFSHYAHGVALEAAARLTEAEAALREAIRFEPWDADFLGSLAGVLLRQSRWADALAAADQGLAIDAESQHCTNMRAMALRQLGRRDEAGATIQDALRRSPENPHSHANLGWTKLHQGKHVEALEHFREALRLNPELDYARMGLVEALKARYLIYRLLLRYFLWMSRLSGRAQLIVIIGLYVLYRVLGNVADNNPAIEPYVTPILVAYFVFGISTWLAPSFFELLLRTSRFGRYALTSQQRIASNVLIGMLLAAGACVAIGYSIDRGAWLIAAIVAALLTMPLVTSLRMDNRVHRGRALLLTAGVALLGAVAVALAFGVGLKAATPVFNWFLYAFLAQSFLMGWIVSRPAPEG